MGLLRRVPALALASSVLLLALRPAHAELAVATPAAGETVIDHAEVAYAFGDSTPVTWISLRVSKGAVAIVAPLPPGASSDSGLDAWLSALEDTASPRVVPPDGETDCGLRATPIWVSWPRNRGRPANAELTLASADDVAAALESFGLVLAEPLLETEAYAVWVWEAADAPFTTKTLRIQRAPQPTGLVAQRSFPVVVSALTRGAMTYEAEQNKQLLDVTFVSGERATSDYREAARRWLGRQGSPLLELRARGPLFEWSIYDDRLTLAPLVHSYVGRASDEGALEDVTACRKQLSQLREGGQQGGADCALADDALLAFRAVDPQSATLIRVLASSAARPATTELFSAGGDPVTPLVIADRLDAGACEPAAPIVLRPEGTLPPPPVRNAPEEGGYEPYVDDRPPSSVSCSDSPAPERDDDPFYESDESPDCSSETSSSSESDEGPDCSSETSSSSESDESPDCSSDTSSSGEAGNETDCASDTSDSSAADESCDGGPETDEAGTGYDGDTCTGSAAPRAKQHAASSSGGARAGRPTRPSRLRMSSWSVAFAAMVLPIRRRKRQTRRDG